MIFPKVHITIERWRWNEQFQIYVSTLGNFKDANKNDLPLMMNEYGYLSVNTTECQQYAHRVVMLTWKPIDNPKSMTIDHINHNKQDNSLSNLEWVTPQENFKRASEDFNSTIGLSFPVTNGTKVFANPHAAAKWLKKKNPNDIPIADIEDRIRTLVKCRLTHKKFYGYTWQKYQKEEKPFVCKQ